MVTEATPAAPEAPAVAAPEIGTPPPADAPELPSQVEEAPASSDEETPAEEEAAPEEPPRAVAQLNAQEQEDEWKALDEKGDREGLRPEERQRIKQLEQAIGNRRANNDRRLKDIEAENDNQYQAEQNVSTQHWQAYLDAMSWVEKAINEGRDPGLERQVAQEKLVTWATHSKAIFDQTTLRDLRKEALERFGDTPENRQAAFGARDTLAFVKAMLAAEHKAGQLEGPDKDHIVLELKAYEAEKTDQYKKGLADGTKRAGELKSSTTSGGTSRNGATAFYRTQEEASIAYNDGKLSREGILAIRANKAIPPR